MKKKFKNPLKNKKYVHFDSKKKPSQCIKNIKNSEWVAHHGFYPFIHYVIKSKKSISSEKIRKNKPKTREIYYSSHIDRYIYQYYGNKLNNAYNKIAKRYCINKSAIAYRNIFNGKCNIHFAKEVIDFISKQEKAFVYVSDFSKFFDRLNHKYLKEKLCEVLEVDKLPKEHYAIYKNIINFTYVERDDILSYKKIDEKKFKKLDKIFDTTQEFQEFKKNGYLKKHKDSENGKLGIGIPQGSSISAVYSNIYMIDFDKQINDYVTSNKGIYRRYCDDIIIVIPIENSNEDYIKHVKKIEDIESKVPNLKINKVKTSKFIYKEKELVDVEGTNKKSFNYLGFYFDGKVVKIRDRSLFKYYSRMYRKVDIVCKYSTKFGRKVYRRKLYRLYSHLGAKVSKNNKKKHKYGNFLTYAYKAYEIFGEDNNYKNLIRLQVARHWKKMNKKLKECENKYNV
ncbi:MAG: reverse transcriptase domain-containing protein [Intestinibacter sp.]|uniref:reverse transcriptase domain-containing protein n=1 Tax=Intestinibacter sp. TaxID=1965304 RepID=UPI002A8391FF|nr:reverse transcriptase domain-containing protein [Intestinibacter sp.]MDY4575287.1 reverse transcriptase domain-containing protein [Intestinibacter sp.]